MFSEAYEEVRRWDDDAAVHYKWNGGQALKNDGDMRGLNEPLRTSSVAHTVALELAPRVTRPADWAGLQNNPGNVYLALTERVGDGTSLELAIDAFHATLEVSQRETAPGDWAMAQNDLGVALEAFAALPSGTVENLLKPENKDQLVAILTMHVLPRVLMSTQLLAKPFHVKTLNADERLTISAKSSGVTVSGSNTAKVVQADVKADNGVIHVIDTVLLP